MKELELSLIVIPFLVSKFLPVPNVESKLDSNGTGTKSHESIDDCILSSVFATNGGMETPIKARITNI